MKHMDLPIIYKDENLLVLNKPAGMLVHASGSKAGRQRPESTVTDWLVEHYPEVKNVGDDPIQRPGIVHRLDKETSGVLIIPRTQATFEYLKKLFQTRQVAKTYTALVMGAVADDAGMIDKPIGIKSGTTKRSVHSDKLVKPALTEYRVTRRMIIHGEECTLLSVQPKTGRTHQIRVHLAAIGHPVVGDKLYGGKKALALPLDRHFLHASAIEFTAPSGERVKLEAELPRELTALLELAQ